MQGGVGVVPAFADRRHEPAGAGFERAVALAFDPRERVPQVLAVALSCSISRATMPMAFATISAT